MIIGCFTGSDESDRSDTFSSCNANWNFSTKVSSCHARSCNVLLIASMPDPPGAYRPCDPIGFGVYCDLGCSVYRRCVVKNV